jgi:cephalosporin-C deacetylase-like acetyl esterase
MRPGLAVLLAIAPAAASASPSTLFPPLSPEDSPRAELVRSLSGIGHDQLRGREQLMSKIDSRPALERRRQHVRQTLLTLMGGLPAQDRTPLGARVVGRLERDGFLVEKVIFESLPGFPVTANLYRPARGAGPFPGVLASVGHGAAGKATELRGPDLARKGFVVLTIDPLGQGERLQHYDPELGTSRAGGATDEHGEAAGRAALIGVSVLRYFVWDAMRALDYLAGRPEVDPQRLGATGCSGGGTVTAALAALDERVKVAAIGCYITSWGQLLDGPGPQEAEQSLPRFLAEGLDMGDYLALIAPRPLLVFSTVNDFFPLEGARAVVEEGRRHYRLMGAPDSLSWFVGPGGHGTPRESREALSAFFLRWFRHGEGDPGEGPDPHLDAEDLACTETGQVSTALHARTVAELIAAEPLPARRLPATAGALPGYRRGIVAAAARAPGIAVRPGGAPPVVTSHRSVERPGYRLDAVSFAAAKGVRVWGLLAVPDRAGRKPAVLLADQRSARTADPGSELDQLAGGGAVVLALEPRGGEPEPDPPGRLSLLGSYAALERRAEVVGKTLVGMRAEDLIRAVDYLATRPDVDRARIVGFGQGGLAVPLLHAAVLDGRIARVAVRDALVSYRSVLVRSIHRNLPEVAIPGVLRQYDLDELLLALGRPVTVINPLDPVGQPVRRAELERTLGPVLAVDRKLGAEQIKVVRRGGPELLLR